MFDLPPQELQKIRKRKEQKQFHEMLNCISKEEVGDKAMAPKEYWLNSLQECAMKQGVNATFVHIPSIENDKANDYVLLSTNKESLTKLIEGGYKDFDEWKEWNNHQDRGIVLLDKVVIDITEVDRHNYFAINSYICRYIQRMGIAKTAFENEDYPLPDHISIAAVESIWELDQMRSNESVPSNLRSRYEKVYHDAIADYAQSYAKKYKDVLTALPHRGKHAVKENYFRDNHIAVTWDVVDDEFWKFVQKQLKAGRYPEFIYYKQDRAFSKVKNLAKQFEKLEKEGTNFWSKDTGRREYHICYPSSQENIFGNLVNEYNTRTLESRVSYEELSKDASPEMPLQMIFLHRYDLANWDSLCKANNVRWCLNDGSYGAFNFSVSNSMEQIPILYRSQDMSIVSGIVDRLTNEMRNYIPLSETAHREKAQRSIEKMNILAEKLSHSKEEIEI